MDLFGSLANGHLVTLRCVSDGTHRFGGSLCTRPCWDDVWDACAETSPSIRARSTTTREWHLRSECSVVVTMPQKAKGDRQKGNQKEKKVTKKWPKTRTMLPKSDRKREKGYQKVTEQKKKWVAYPLLPTPFCGTLKWFVCLSAAVFPLLLQFFCVSLQGIPWKCGEITKLLRWELHRILSCFCLSWFVSNRVGAKWVWTRVH